MLLSREIRRGEKKGEGMDSGAWTRLNFLFGWDTSCVQPKQNKRLLFPALESKMTTATEKRLQQYR